MSWPGSGVDSCIARSCVSTLPPGPNHLSPLLENEGHAFTKTVTIIAPISARTAIASAPSMRSVRWSSERPLRRGMDQAAGVTASVNRDPAGVDDRADRLVTGLGDPGDELRSFALGDALGDHPEVAHTAVLPRLGVRERARHALVADRIHTRGVGEGDEADACAARIVVHRVLLEAVGGLFGGARRDLQRFAEEDVLEGVLRTRGAVAVEQVDRP